MGETRHQIESRPAGKPPRRVLPTGFATLRDIITFAVGMAIICNEVFLQGKVEPTTLAIGAAMAGLPLVFSADERRKTPPQEPPATSPTPEEK